MSIAGIETAELSKEYLLRIYPFFGIKSLCIDSLQAQRTSKGEIGRKAVGTWVIPETITEEHFNDFETTKSRQVANLRLIPGHFWAEALGQALGALAYLKYPEHIMDVLPTFEKASSEYKEAAFPGDKVNLCVELTRVTTEKGRLRIYGRGAAVFNERTLAVVRPIKVRTISLPIAIRALQGLRTMHQTEPWITANFDNFPKYFAQIGA